MASVSKLRDKRLPFREHAPSRLAITAPGGPYGAENLRTREGFFSALIFRAISFSSESVKKGHIFFSTLAEYQALVKQHKDNISYLCIMSAYGPPQKIRSPALASDHWRSSELWEEFLDEDVTLSFSEFYQLLRQKNIKNVGELTAFLLAGDYVYAGVVEMPSVEEVGSLIWQLKKGALSGLRDIGLVSEDSKVSVTEKEVISAFRSSYDFTKQKLDHYPGLADAITFDPLMMEHSLCKFHRLNILKDGVP